jgi:hypothetical protein
MTAIKHRIPPSALQSVSGNVLVCQQIDLENIFMRHGGHAITSVLVGFQFLSVRLATMCL